MAWNKNLPTDTTVLRLIPSTIRSNNDGIENGDVPFASLQMQRIVNDPATIANTGWLYNKNPGTGFNEAFFKNSNGNITQLTSSGSLGSTTTNVVASNVTASTLTLNSFAYDKNALANAWASINANGSVASTYGLTCIRTSAGNYQLSFTTPASNLNYIVVATANANENRARIVTTYLKTLNNFNVFIQVNGASATTYEDTAFSILVYGAR